MEGSPDAALGDGQCWKWCGWLLDSTPLGFPPQVGRRRPRRNGSLRRGPPSFSPPPRSERDPGWWQLLSQLDSAWSRSQTHPGQRACPSSSSEGKHLQGGCWNQGSGTEPPSAAQGRPFGPLRIGRHGWSRACGFCLRSRHSQLDGPQRHLMPRDRWDRVPPLPPSSGPASTGGIGGTLCPGGGVLARWTGRHSARHPREGGQWSGLEPWSECQELR